MKTGRISFFYLIMLFIFFNRIVFAETSIKKNKSDEYEIIFSELKNDSIRILQVTDLHLGNPGRWESDFSVIRRIKMYVKQYDPDFIVVTGDMFTGNQKESKENLFMFAAQSFDDMERPWLYEYGNHCPEKYGRDVIHQVFVDSEWGILGYHKTGGDSVKYDYKVDLELAGEKQPLWQVYAFDSGSEPGNKSIKEDQVNWYKQKSEASKAENKRIVPAISIFHIPFIQYKWLWEDDTFEKQGEFHENVCFEEDNGSVYDAFVEQGNIKACFCGHDHDNNYYGKYKGGIILAYGHVSGETCYHRHWPPGAKFIRLPLKGGEIYIKDLVDVSD